MNEKLIEQLMNEREKLFPNGCPIQKIDILQLHLMNGLEINAWILIYRRL